MPTDPLTTADARKLAAIVKANPVTFLRDWHVAAALASLADQLDAKDETIAALVAACRLALDGIRPSANDGAAWATSLYLKLGNAVQQNAQRLHQPGTNPRDWPEDFEHENGNYLNHCRECGHNFWGHKRRVTCKACDAERAALAASTTKAREA